MYLLPFKYNTMDLACQGWPKYGVFSYAVHLGDVLDPLLGSSECRTLRSVHGLMVFEKEA